MIRSLLGALLVSGVAWTAFAHTSLESAAPESGAELERSPAAIELKFKDAVRLTSVVATAADGGERKLSFSPVTSSQQFSVDNPALTEGRNQIRWKALSRDGHVLNGSLVYVVKPPSPQASE